MRFAISLFVLLTSFFFITNGHPWGDLSHRHRRSDDDGGGTGKECYFSKERKTKHEKLPRTAHSTVSSKCSGKLIRLSELMDVNVNNLYQAPNYPALILERGEGQFDIDWSDKNKVEEIGKIVICSHHEAELGRNWHANFYQHYLKKERAHRKVTDPVCSMPPPFFQHTEREILHVDRHYIEADEAEAILKIKGILVHPGLPVCPAHNAAAQEILAQFIVQSKGHSIHPPPIDGDFSITPHVTHSDTRDKSDPNFFPHHRENPAPINTAFIPPPKFSQKVKTAYASFMETLGLGSIATKNWHELDDRSQRRKAEGISIATDAMAHLMAPQDPEALKTKAFKAPSSYERPRPKAFVEMMMHVKKAFENAPTRAERLAALSMVSHLHLPEIQKYIPLLSKYFHEAARKNAQRGYHLVTFPIRRVRFNRRKINRALEFVTSYKVTIDSPYGTREVKDSYGRWIEIPNTLRSMRVGEIYYQYKKDLEVTNDMDQLVPESTFRKMLRICKAERRKSLHGVDIVIADSMESFDRADIAIQNMLSKNWISKTWHDSLRSEMLGSRQYLRTDYVAHGKEFSTTGDHCWSFGLSDPEDVDFQVDCQKDSTSWMHSHSRICHQCENVQVWFGNLRATTDGLLEKHKGEKKITQEIELLRRDIDDWEIKIEKLKKHQLRTGKSENDRQWLASGLKPGDCLLTADWAMKMMKLNPRESTSDWYGQRGMNWHIGHVLVYEGGEYWQHHYVHILEGEKQDSVAVTAIIRSIFQKLAAVQIKRVFLRSDQAGCYKSSSTISSLKSIAEEVGIEVVKWVFSEAQAGKGPCDRGAATFKGIARGYADSNHPVTNTKEFFEALTHDGRVYEGLSVHLVRLEGTGEDKKPEISPSKIPELSKYNSFSFEPEGIRVHRFWNIGKGKVIPYKGLVANDGVLIEEKSGGALTGPEYWMRLGEPRKKKDHSTTEEPEKEKDGWEDEDEEEDEDSFCMKDTESKKCRMKKQLVSALYRCPVESCSKEYLTEAGLEKHLTVGRHLRRPERENVQDYALHQFSSFIETIFPPRVCPLIEEATKSLTDDNDKGIQQKMGWALPAKRRSTRFPPIVKEFLKNIYDEGEKTGAKQDARGAENMMRVATKPGGEMLFAIDDLLTSRQIAGVFTGFKHTKLEKRRKVEQKHKKKKPNEDEEEEIEVEEEEEVDEVNELFKTEGDPELEYKTEPLFDEEEAMRREIIAADDIFDDEDDEMMET